MVVADALLHGISELKTLQECFASFKQPANCSVLVVYASCSKGKITNSV